MGRGRGRGRHAGDPQHDLRELNFEKIAGLRPDLILGVYSGITDKEYETLSKIAPTVAQTDDYVDFGVPWQDMTRTVGRALGRSARAEKLVDELEGRFAGLREQNPGFAGKSLAVASYSGGGEEAGFFASEDPRSRFFTSLGFVVPPALDEIAGDEFFGRISRERSTCSTPTCWYGTSCSTWKVGGPPSRAIPWSSSWT
ncbi:MAG: ABC transporter substrate-binding protein [Actinomycetota bacterium]|nr:ABC transporter substrate-binding protein [Actinomycetota bacterium]